jgi:two-component system, NtrC family, sensor kinase
MLKPRRAEMPELGQGGRILVIDDQETTRYVFRRILSGAGFKVTEAKTGAEGLAKALEDPDIIISDVNLPDMLGYDLSRRLKSNPSTSAIPVLQISASFISDESKAQALEGGADSYLAQPVEPAILIAQVHALIRMRKAEVLSRLSARHWQTTFDALSDGLALVNRDGVVIRANQSLLQLLDLNHSDAEGKTIADVFNLRFDTPFADFVANRTPGQPMELSYGSRWFRVRYDPVNADPREEDGFIFLLTEVTHQRKLQETLKMTERLAATGRLAHVIAHEINNPLEALANLLYLIHHSPSLDEMNRGFVSQSLTELERISQITKQILAYHRESKEPLLTDGTDLLQGVLTMFRPQMIVSHIELRTHFKASRPVWVHPGEMRQAFSNLVSNALDAMGDSGGTLCIRCIDTTDSQTGRKGVRFIFSDSGSGISHDILPHIFEAFYTTKGLKGSGIGLWLTSEVIAKHRGRIRARSRTTGSYKGTLFDVFLPQRGPDQLV